MLYINLRGRFVALISFMLFSFMSRSAFVQGSSDIASQLATIDNAGPEAPILKTQDRVKKAFDSCIRDNSRTEFDTAETLLARAEKTPCRFGGVATFRGRGDELMGDLLQYDPQHEVIYWAISLQRLRISFTA